MSRRSVTSLSLLILLAIGYVLVGRTGPPAAADSDIRTLAAEQRSGVMVTGEGRVARVLPDDTVGDRHQRFVLELADGLTVLISHNIDLAPRVAIDNGDLVRFRGQYEWNTQGGVIHWTHHDPAGRHDPGWIETNGQRVE